MTFRIVVHDGDLVGRPMRHRVGSVERARAVWLDTAPAEGSTAP